MALPTPNLDDRRFQDLVDDAKRMVQRRCPEWTDHNVSDPGVTLIETFAFMTDQLLYRLNRVPDRLYVKFLELIGIRMLPPTAAGAPVTFWLTAPARTTNTVPRGTKTATARVGNEPGTTFATTEDLVLVPSSLKYLRTEESEGEELQDPAPEIKRIKPFPAFSAEPKPGDALLIGLEEPVPRCAVRLDLDCQLEGVGVDPTHPPLVWEAYDGEEWIECDVPEDPTGGLNRKGAIVLHIPAEHRAAIVDGQRGGWLRARVTKTEEGQPGYSVPPVIHGIKTATIGGTARSVHAEIIDNEALGTAEGVPGQAFTARRTPILTGAGECIVEVSTDDGWERWDQVQTFADSGPQDRHVVVDGSMGRIEFGPAVREANGSLRQYGAVPPQDAAVRLRRYATGGGRSGNVARFAIQTLKSPIPFVTRVENRYPAQGGVDGETIEEAKARGPLVLRARSRAVTAEDYEAITHEAAPEVARVRCLTAGEHDVDAGSVKVLVVPTAANVAGRIEFEDLVPTTNTLKRITDRLNDVRLVGARVLVEPPRYQGVTVVARIIARQYADFDQIRKEALDGLYQFLNPLTGGNDGKGWPFGRDVQVGEIYSVLQRVNGVDYVEDARLFGANPVTGDRGPQTNRLVLDPNSLVFSYDHHVKVEEMT
ncbi:putative baseplate assembly protein [Kitasatospora sp. NPDC048540]|uniref:putative baseplate assembly protein n=1 Tax=unclassified Kitasatospora TaxID=2633591 RepID=UPI000539A970|nr:putative baseplate assembly protein [Kitasatospora sp. MBT63]